MEKKAKNARKDNAENSKSNSKTLAVIGIIVIVAIIAGALAYGLTSTPATSFNSFKSRFNSAQRIGIVAYGYNGTEVSYTVGCASAIIESVVGSASSHRNASTIDFYIVNSTECVSEHGVAGTVQNYTNSTAGNCISEADAEPSIFISYNNTNSTKVTQDSLQIKGDGEFLSMCGISSEIS